MLASRSSTHGRDDADRKLVSLLLLTIGLCVSSLAISPVSGSFYFDKEANDGSTNVHSYFHGNRFNYTVSGSISTLRAWGYQGSPNQTVTIWRDSTRTLLGQCTMVPSVTGWNLCNLTSPVTINAFELYMVAHSNDPNADPAYLGLNYFSGTQGIPSPLPANIKYVDTYLTQPGWVAGVMQYPNRTTDQFTYPAVADADFQSDIMPTALSAPTTSPAAACNSSLSVSSQVTSSGSPVAGVLVTLRIIGSDAYGNSIIPLSCTAVSGSDGTATCNLTPDRPSDANGYSLFAFISSPVALISPTSVLVVGLKTTAVAVTYTGATSGETADYLYVAGRSNLVSLSGNPVAGQWSFFVNGAYGCSATAEITTINSGACRLDAPLPAGTVSLTARYEYQLDMCNLYLGESTVVVPLFDLNSMSVAIANETSIRQSVDSALSTNLASEISARQLADVFLSANLTSEVNGRVAAVAAVTASLATEAAARIAVDNTLATNISALTINLAAETNARQSADAALNSNLTSEVNARVAAVAAVSNNLANETAARIAADITLATNLASEVNTRSVLASNVTTLSTSLSALTSRVAALEVSAPVTAYLFEGLSSHVSVSYPNGVTPGATKYLNFVIPFNLQLSAVNTLITYSTSTNLFSISRGGIYRLDAFIHLVDQTTSNVGTGVVAWQTAAGALVGPNVLNPNAGGISQGTPGDDSIVSSVVVVPNTVSAASPYQVKIVLLTMNEKKNLITDASTVSITRLG